MAQIFYVILSLSVSGGLFGIILLLLRPVTKRFFAKKWTYYLWILVLVRLMLPVHAEFNMMEQLSGKLTEMGSQWGSEDNTLDSTALAKITNMRNTQAVPEEMEENRHTDMQRETKQEHLQNADNGINAETVGQKRTVFLRMACILWVLGVFLSAVWRMYVYVDFVRGIRADSVMVTSREILKIGAEIQAKLRIGNRVPLYESGTIGSPMLIGLRNPFIVIPSELLTAIPERENDICLILHHELVHYKRHDIWYKWLFQAVLCVHWFNPLVYLFNRKFNTDCELACDEMVMELLSNEGRKAYGNVLLDVADKNFQEGSLSVHKNVPAMTLLEEKRTLKERLQGIAQYHKKGIMIGISSVMVLAVLTVAAVLCGVSGVRFPSEINTIKSPGIVERFGNSMGGTFTDIFSDGFMSEPMLVKKNGNAYQMYDDDVLIAGDCESDVWRAHRYRGGGKSVDCQKFLFNGSDILWIIDADKDTTLEITSSFTLLGGRFKVVQVMPDQTVRILNENGEKVTGEVTLSKGRNCFKMVGQEARLKDFSITYGGEEEQALNGVFRSEEEEYAYRVMVGQEPFDVSRLEEICAYLEAKEVSELCRTAWESDMVLSDEAWQNVFIYSDEKLTARYLLEALQNGKVKEFDSGILCMVAHVMDGKDVSECFRYLLEQGKVVQSDWQEIFIYGDNDLSVAYLVEALQKGKGSGFNGQILGQISVQIPSQKLRDIVLALDKEELSFDNLTDNVISYLDREQNMQCILHYIDLGNVLTDSQLREIEMYVSESDFYRIVEQNGKNK